MTIDAERVIVAAERLYSTACALRDWATAHPQLSGIPQPLQAVIDAAEWYADQLEQFHASEPQPNEEKGDPRLDVSR